MSYNYNSWANDFQTDSFPPGSQNGWRGTNSYSQHEQYNPAYPSLNGGPINDYYGPVQGNAARTFPAKKSSIRSNIPRKGGEESSSSQAPNFVLIETEIPGGSVPAGRVEPQKHIQAAVGGTSSPKKKGKVAHIKRGGGGNFKAGRMPYYNGLNQGHGDWATFQQYSQQSVGRGGGGKGNRNHRGRGGQNGRRRLHKPMNSKDDIPFVPVDDNTPVITIPCASENIVAFHGFDSVFTTQHNFPVRVDDKIYNSCDHYYQIRKIVDLTGVVPDILNASVRDATTGKMLGVAPTEKKASNTLAREILKAAGVEKAKVDEWRLTKGLEAIQTALLAKVSQSAHLREALKETGNSALVHAYIGDSIYGTGCGVIQIRKWLDELKNAGVQSLKVPATFPMTAESVKGCPVFAQGRNILGVILMQLREKIRKNEIEVANMTETFEALRSNGTEEKMDTTTNSQGFVIGESVPHIATF